MDIQEIFELVYIVCIDSRLWKNIQNSQFLSVWRQILISKWTPYLIEFHCMNSGVGVPRSVNLHSSFLCHLQFCISELRYIRLYLLSMLLVDSIFLILVFELLYIYIYTEYVSCIKDHIMVVCYSHLYQLIRIGHGVVLCWWSVIMSDRQYFTVLCNWRRNIQMYTIWNF